MIAIKVIRVVTSEGRVVKMGHMGGFWGVSQSSASCLGWW